MLSARKERLDRLLTKRGLAPNISQAQRMILAGLVRVEGKPALKAGTRIGQEILIEVKEGERKYVSRGGEKLAAALEHFGLRVTGKIALDVGASTGGFTDCLLKEGAAQVYAVDVGYGQLAWQLRQDPRVISLERKNARYLKMEDIPEAPEIVAIDVSFISLTKIIPVVMGLAAKGAEILALIKPQFELGREEVGRGVVRDPAKHNKAVLTVSNFCRSIGLEILGTFPSPLLGPKGNREFFIRLKKAS